jgi:hypothetical protein
VSAGQGGAAQPTPQTGPPARGRLPAERERQDDAEEEQQRGDGHEGNCAADGGALVVHVAGAARQQHAWGEGRGGDRGDESEHDAAAGAAAGAAPLQLSSDGGDSSGGRGARPLTHDPADREYKAKTKEDPGGVEGQGASRRGQGAGAHGAGGKRPTAWLKPQTPAAARSDASDVGARTIRRCSTARRAPAARRACPWPARRAAARLPPAARAPPATGPTTRGGRGAGRGGARRRGRGAAGGLRVAPLPVGGAAPRRALAPARRPHACAPAAVGTTLTRCAARRPLTTPPGPTGVAFGPSAPGGAAAAGAPLGGGTAG